MVAAPTVTLTMGAPAQLTEPVHGPSPPQAMARPGLLLADGFALVERLRGRASEEHRGGKRAERHACGFGPVTSYGRWPRLDINGVRVKADVNHEYKTSEHGMRHDVIMVPGTKDHTSGWCFG